MEIFSRERSLIHNFFIWSWWASNIYNTYIYAMQYIFCWFPIPGIVVFSFSNSAKWLVCGTQYTVSVYCSVPGLLFGRRTGAIRQPGAQTRSVTIPCAMQAIVLAWRRLHLCSVVWYSFLFLLFSFFFSLLLLLFSLYFSWYTYTYYILYLYIHIVSCISLCEIASFAENFMNMFVWPLAGTQ